MSYNEPLEVKDKNGLRIEINHDEIAMSPRDWDNLTHIFSLHKRYQIGDEHNYRHGDFNSYAEFRDQLERDYNIVKIKPLYIYDHSGVTIDTSPFQSHWDSGQCGFVFVTEESQEKMGTPDDRIEKLMDGEVETLDQYLRGEVYEYKVTDKKTGETLDQCAGFFSKDDALERAKSFVEHKIEQRREKRREKLKALIKNAVPFQEREKILAGMDGGS